MKYYVVTTERGNEYLVTGMTFMGEIIIKDICLCGQKFERHEGNLKREGYDVCPRCQLPAKTYKFIAEVPPEMVKELLKKARGRQNVLKFAKRGTEEEVKASNSDIPPDVKAQLEAILGSSGNSAHPSYLKQ